MFWYFFLLFQRCIFKEFSEAAADAPLTAQNGFHESALSQ
jgi:hypothetical protein